nr:SEC-C metal-binding domain-containing protein [Scatolibacter rhodanostii]
MALLQDWHEYAEKMQNQENAAEFWNNYFKTEKEIYAKILTTKPRKNTVRGYAEKFDVDIMTMVAFLDGINDSLKDKNAIEDMTEDTEVNLNFEKELLYKNMVDAGADWLYNLSEWDKHLTPERRKELYKEQKSSKTVVKDRKIGRNEPCPCGSGKKYKKCCGRDE